jgi:hypothetical protein
MPFLKSRVLAAFLVVTITVTASAQQAPVLPKKALAIKHKIDSLSPHAPISLIPVQGKEAFGEFLSRDAEGFTFRDIDQKTDVTLKFVDVRKVKDGYGGYNSAKGRHTDRTKALIITAVVVGGLGALIGAAAAAKN